MTYVGKLLGDFGISESKGSEKEPDQAKPVTTNATASKSFATAFDFDKVKKADAKRFGTVFSNQNHTFDRSKDVASYPTSVNKKALSRPKVLSVGAKNVNDVLKQQPEYQPAKPVPGNPLSTTN